MRTTDLDDALRSLDPAISTVSTAAERKHRADTDLHRILATPRPQPAARAARSRRTMWRGGLVAVAVSALVLVAGGVAFDTWRPTTASAT